MTTLFGFRLPLGDAVDAIVEWITTYLGGVFDVIAAIFTFFYEWIEYFLTTPPFWAVIVVLVAVAFWAKGWKLALGTLIGLAVIVSIGEWSYAMESLALVVVAAGIAVVLSLPLGVWAARSDAASRTIKPVLDFMQTTPAFVYLIPALILFGIGPVPGIVATIVFAMAPGVRLTELGIRGVSSEVVEAGAAFGSSPWRILRQIQLPLARPSIMAGVNQVIMLSLSMVVIAGMVGAGGLGGQIVAALNRIDVGLGSEAGISVVILAIVLDRMTAAFGGDRKKRAPRRSTAAAAPTGDDDQESASQQAGQPVPVGA
ncbi:glycine betaine/proline transport system permease protein [Curtobacterium sp. PhB142]|uniref:ABC transporter permease n=1 Tax=unclassified Curtobacterium TaxID=257496 RepID=UPI00104C9708|nr:MULTISPECIES: ABC transporter permease subunit [unclassified Curtobacterium]TCL86698.1 glycine betaine/proline transport system permease protein [Curtobacterium sp. PhB142]TCM03400.1 glycine betaine/proline transport system permease protein [Curtobacterium sp. PhB134]TDW64777.1 glycine betaine/proline transport system permease protein [Curtobacterium sp. PhB25]